MIGHFAVADDVFEAGELIGKNGGEEILGFHALQRRGRAATTALSWHGQRARGIPAPANRKHRRVEQRLHENVANGFGIEIAKDFVERKGMLRAERNDNGVVGRGGLQFEIETAAKSFAQSQSPGAIDAIAKGRMEDQLHSAGFVEEPFHDQRLLRRNHAERLVSVRRNSSANLLGGLGCGKACISFGSQPCRRGDVCRQSAECSHCLDLLIAQIGNGAGTIPSFAPGASPSQNGIPGGWPCASSTRTLPDSIRRIFHDALPSWKISPAILSTAKSSLTVPMNVSVGSSTTR